MGFESVKKERSAKAWNFFNFHKSTEEAKCLLCQKIMKAKGSTTKSLNDHMKVKHRPKSGQALEMRAKMLLISLKNIAK